ncbi:hypothetical protein BCR34DRAFT_584321 [Clohesyomyces aquaticus]|uniref:Uncharacterized protein n=1 Tax=Clohesyomyces aquaticus TaxID=1231657 RepID=A0A1Y2A1J2_9PLEO|nr:hypothetical protein BCR34DRAFT_584321 [Clohesyomyces aquaticus]
MHYTCPNCRTKLFLPQWVIQFLPPLPVSIDTGNENVVVRIMRNLRESVEIDEDLRRYISLQQAARQAQARRPADVSDTPAQPDRHRRIIRNLRESVEIDEELRRHISLRQVAQQAQARLECGRLSEAPWTPIDGRGRQPNDQARRPPISLSTSIGIDGHPGPLSREGIEARRRESLLPSAMQSTPFTSVPDLQHDRIGHSITPSVENEIWNPAVALGHPPWNTPTAQNMAFLNRYASALSLLDQPDSTGTASAGNIEAREAAPGMPTRTRRDVEAFDCVRREMEFPRFMRTTIRERPSRIENFGPRAEANAANARPVLGICQPGNDTERQSRIHTLLEDPLREAARTTLNDVQGRFPSHLHRRAGNPPPVDVLINLSASGSSPPHLGTNIAPRVFSYVPSASAILPTTTGQQASGALWLEGLSQLESAHQTFQEQVNTAFPQGVPDMMNGLDMNMYRTREGQFRDRATSQRFYVAQEFVPVALDAISLVHSRVHSGTPFEDVPVLRDVMRQGANLELQRKEAIQRLMEIRSSDSNIAMLSSCCSSSTPACWRPPSANIVQQPQTWGRGTGTNRNPEKRMQERIKGGASPRDRPYTEANL